MEPKSLNSYEIEGTAERPSSEIVVPQGAFSGVAGPPPDIDAAMPTDDPFFSVAYAIALGSNTYSIPDAGVSLRG
jgi:hypothetical protein